VNPSIEVMLTIPTAGGATPQVATPTFSPVAGTYGSAQSVVPSCATTGASMFYTTDGSTPTTGSTPYTTAISVTSSETLKVLATKSGFTNSAIGSAAYVISTSNIPQNVRVILQGCNGANTNSGNSTPAQPNHCSVGWTAVSSATSYNIYRSVNGGAFGGTPYDTITESAATTYYGTYVTNQGSFSVDTTVNRAYQDTSATGIANGTKGSSLTATASFTNGSNVLNITSIAGGGVTAGGGIGVSYSVGGIPLGTKINTFGSGGTTGTGSTGTYQMSANATSTQTGVLVGTVYFQNNSYNYQVTSVVGGVESAPSATNIIILNANGWQIMNAGNFGVTNINYNTSAPSTTPLGYSKCAVWQFDATSGDNAIGLYTGHSGVNQNISIGGMQYLVYSIYPSVSGRNSLTLGTEIGGDQVLYGTIDPTTYGTLTANTWTTWKFPVGDVLTDGGDGNNVLQVSLYKQVFSQGPNNQPYYFESYLSPV
jgi:Chitobiase/beta-hexosaminidase C-terminal domain